MSCLQNCCEQELDPLDPLDFRTPVTESAETSAVEFEPELVANGDGPNGLGTMCSVNMAMSCSEVQEALGEASFQSHVSDRIRETDLEILRGITLRESLCRGASMWRKNPEQLL